MYVITMDQRRSRGSVDLVDGWAATLNGRHATGLVRPFVRTSGDEMQAVAGDAKALIDIAVETIRTEAWWLGIGLGSVAEPLGQTARDSRGPAFWDARQAVEDAKQRSWGAAVAGEPTENSQDLDAALALLSFVVRSRTERAWRMIDLLVEGRNQSQVAMDLGVSKQAVSKVLRASGRDEEDLGHRLAANLARLASA